jgi:hypothetical protein
MNRNEKQSDIKIRRSSFTPVVLGLLIAMAGLSWWVSAPARTADSFNTALVPMIGMVSEPPESVVFSAQEVVQRPLASAYKVEITFPFLENTTTGISSAWSGVASFAFNFNLTTGAATAAGAIFTEPISRSDYRMKGG